MRGVVITARKTGASIAHSVVSDDAGRYAFPAALLEPGRYALSIRAVGYDGWLTVEAFGRSVPALSAATRVWRDLFPDLDTLFTESIALIRREWAAA